MLKKILLAVLVAAPMCLMAQAPKFGYVNPLEIFNVMPERATAENTLKTAADKFDTEAKNLQDAFQKKVADYEAQAKDPSTPDAIKQRHEEELQNEYQKIMNFQQTAQQELSKQQEQLLAPIQQKLQDAIKAVGAEGGYTFIYDSSSLLYTGNGAEDISAKVKAKLGIK